VGTRRCAQQFVLYTQLCAFIDWKQNYVKFPLVKISQKTKILNYYYNMQMGDGCGAVWG